MAPCCRSRNSKTRAFALGEDSWWSRRGGVCTMSHDALRSTPAGRADQEVELPQSDLLVKKIRHNLCLASKVCPGWQDAEAHGSCSPLKQRRPAGQLTSCCLDDLLPHFLTSCSLPFLKYFILNASCQCEGEERQENKNRRMIFFNLQKQ